MSNPFSSFSSASIAPKTNPHAGATQKDVQAATIAIVAIRQAIDSDELGPTRVVSDGKLAWINTFLREMLEFRLVDRDNAEILWKYFEHEHRRRFPDETPAQVLDAHSEVSPLTVKEIRDSFKITTASAPEMRRQAYGPDDYDFDNHARKLVDDIPAADLLSRANQEGAGDES